MSKLRHNLESFDKIDFIQICIYWKLKPGKFISAVNEISTVAKWWPVNAYWCYICKLFLLFIISSPAYNTDIWFSKGSIHERYRYIIHKTFITGYTEAHMEYLIIRPSFWHEIEINARDVSRLASKLVIFAQLWLTHKWFKNVLKSFGLLQFLKDSYQVYDVLIMKL